MKLSGLAQSVRGELRGDGGLEITGAAGLEDATAADVTYIADPAHARSASGSKAGCFLVTGFIVGLERPQVKVEDPERAFYELLGRLRPRPSWPSGISEMAHMDSSATVADGAAVMPFAHVSGGASIGRGTVIAPGVFVGPGSSIGEDCLIYPNVCIMDGVKIGHRVIIHSCTVIGSDGYGFMQRGASHIKKPQVGGVIVGDDVEIGANCAIDRATSGNTVIGAGTKIDNLVQVAHNVSIGKGCLIAGQAGVAGSSRLGDYVVMAGQAGVRDHVNVAGGVILAGRCGLTADIKDKGVYAGMPAQPMGDWLKSSATFLKLPELSKRIRALEKRLEEIEKDKDRS